MTEAEQFLTEFLGVQENDFPITLNLKLYAEALEAYVAHIEKKKADVILQVGVAGKLLTDKGWVDIQNTNDIQKDYNSPRNWINPLE